MVDHGPEPVAEALDQALAAGRCDLLALKRATELPAAVDVPERLAAYEIDSSRVEDFDTLLPGGIS